jgi:hypothetical protein
MTNKIGLFEAKKEFQSLLNDDADFPYNSNEFVQWVIDHDIDLACLYTEYHRKPTKSEIKFGEGAIHYKSFHFEIFLKPNGDIKKWLVCPHDGLRYYR